MKRILAVFFILLSLTSCAANSDMPDTEQGNFTTETSVTEPGNNITEPEAWESPRVYRAGYYGNVTGGGKLYYDGENRLCFIDFATMEPHVVCKRIGCDHKDTDVCPSYSVVGAPIIQNEDIYFFDHTEGYEFRLCRFDLIGGAHETVLSVPERLVSVLAEKLVMGETLYFCAETDVYDDSGMPSGNVTVILCSYDFSSGEYKELSELISAASASVNLIGIFGGGLYFSTSHIEEEIPWQFYADPTFNIISYLTAGYYRFDLENGTVEKTDGNVYYADENILMSTDFYGEYRVKFANGTWVSISKNFDMPVGKYLFDFDDGFVYDTSARCAYKLLLPMSDGGRYLIPVAFSGSSFAVLDPDTDEYRKYPVEEVVGDPADMPSISFVDPNAEFPYNLEWGSYTDVPEYRERVSAATVSEDRKRYFEMLDPELPERTREYYSLLDATPGGGLAYYFSGEHYCTTASFTSIYYVGMIIDTDIAAECSVDLRYTEVNLDTFEERNVELHFENSEGEQGMIFITYPDEGFYIMNIELAPHFSTIRLSESVNTDVNTIRGMIEMEERAVALLSGE